MGDVISLQASDREDDDVAFDERLVEVVLERYTKPGDLIIDPFVGFGTTMVVAERMDRVAYGIELLDERADLARARVVHPERVITGDARRIGELDLPRFDFSLTSPPYMTRHEHPQNPLDAYLTLDADYDVYLAELTAIYAQLRDVMRIGAGIAVNVANIRSPAGMTFLAWDVGRVVSEVLLFEDEIPIAWDHQHEMISQDYCLVFRRG